MKLILVHKGMETIYINVDSIVKVHSHGDVTEVLANDHAGRHATYTIKKGTEAHAKLASDLGGINL